MTLLYAVGSWGSSRAESSVFVVQQVYNEAEPAKRYAESCKNSKYDWAVMEIEEGEDLMLGEVILTVERTK